MKKVFINIFFDSFCEKLYGYLFNICMYKVLVNHKCKKTHAKNFNEYINRLYKKKYNYVVTLINPGGGTNISKGVLFVWQKARVLEG